MTLIQKISSQARYDHFDTLPYKIYKKRNFNYFIRMLPKNQEGKAEKFSAIFLQKLTRGSRAG